MPHITIEHSANVAEHHDIDALVGAVHRAALDHGLPPIEGLRTRASSCDHYRVATGDDRFAYVAIHCRIAPGRTDESKRTFVESILDAAEAQITAEGGPLSIAWSIELTELDPAMRLNRNHVRTALEQETSS